MWILFKKYRINGHFVFVFHPSRELHFKEEDQWDEEREREREIADHRWWECYLVCLGVKSHLDGDYWCRMFIGIYLRCAQCM